MLHEPADYSIFSENSSRSHMYFSFWYLYISRLQERISILWRYHLFIQRECPQRKYQLFHRSLFFSEDLFFLDIPEIISTEWARIPISSPTFIARAWESERLRIGMIPVSTIMDALVSGYRPVRYFIVIPPKSIEILTNTCIFRCHLPFVDWGILPSFGIVPFFEHIDTRMGNIGK
jgi:hypothetical protein